MYVNELDYSNHFTMRNMSKHRIAYFKYMQLLFANYTSVKRGGEGKEPAILIMRTASITHLR